MSFRAERAGREGLAALRGGTATVFAAFERSCYVETPAGIACLGGPGVGMGPLNVLVSGFEVTRVGDSVDLETGNAKVWKPVRSVSGGVPLIEIPDSIAAPAESFLRWLEGEGSADEALIGLGPGLTPAGDDFVGGAMIALRAFGHVAAAERIAAWALPLAKARTNRISRAHLECAARGEGHEALHDWLAAPSGANLARLASIGHSSGLDAAAGASLALRAVATLGLAPAA